jgi:hypothetical protein
LKKEEIFVNMKKKAIYEKSHMTQLVQEKCWTSARLTGCMQLSDILSF